MTDRQKQIIERLKRRIIENDIPDPKLREVKKEEIKELECGLIHFYIEIGITGDERTAASIFCRNRRHIIITKRGGIQLMNAKRKSLSRGFDHAIWATTE